MICSYTECFLYPAQHHVLKLRLGTNSPQVPGDSWSGSRCLCGLAVLALMALQSPTCQLPCEHSCTAKLRRRRRRRRGRKDESTSTYLHLMLSAAVWPHMQQHTSPGMCSKARLCSPFSGAQELPQPLALCAGIAVLECAGAGQSLEFF